MIEAQVLKGPLGEGADVRASPQDGHRMRCAPAQKFDETTGIGDLGGDEADAVDIPLGDVPVSFVEATQVGDLYFEVVGAEGAGEVERAEEG
jgi:hypothetical protein